MSLPAGLRRGALRSLGAENCLDGIAGLRLQLAAICDEAWHDTASGGQHHALPSRLPARAGLRGL